MLISAALAAPLDPSEERKLELDAEGGVYTAESAIGFGLDGSVRSGKVIGSFRGVAGGRTPTFDTPVSRRVGVGLATAELDVRFGGQGREEPVGFVVLLDAAFLDPVERDCTRSGCRSTLFLGGLDAPFGVSFQPAVGLRLLSDGVSDARASVLLAAQPTLWYGQLLPVPRLEVTGWREGGAWSWHLWGSRYGLAFGVGRALTGS